MCDVLLKSGVCTSILTFTDKEKYDTMKYVKKENQVSAVSTTETIKTQICVCSHDIHAGWILTQFHPWHVSSSPYLQKKRSSNSSCDFAAPCWRGGNVTISPTLIEDHRNSPVLVLIPIRKSLFPVLMLKRSSGRWTVKQFEKGKKSMKHLHNWKTSSKSTLAFSDG